MAKINFGGVWEEVVTSEEFTLSRAQEVLKGETVAVLGYGVQGPGQALNLRDNGIRVIVGQREGGKTWQKAVDDGFVPGKTLFPVEEAAKRGTVIEYLLSDAGQTQMWPTLKPYLTKGKTLYFSHGFSITYRSQTNVIPPSDIDVVLVAPKGSGRSLRTNFLDGSGLNSSYAIFQDASGKATEKTLALGIAIGSGYLFPTTFEKEVFSDLTGERGVLMGALAGVMEAQYNVLRKNGHSPSEAFNETVEELTQSLIRLVAENGMDWMYANCSTTAQRPHRRGDADRAVGEQRPRLPREAQRGVGDDEQNGDVAGRRRRPRPPAGEPEGVKFALLLVTLSPGFLPWRGEGSRGFPPFQTPFTDPRENPLT
jgi:ketol-acid reductoisomerase